MDLQCIFVVHRFLTKSLLFRTIVYLKRNNSASETSPISGYWSRQLAVNSDTAHRDMLQAPHAFLLFPSVPTPNLRCWMVLPFLFFSDITVGLISPKPMSVPWSEFTETPKQVLFHKLKWRYAYLNGHPAQVPCGWLEEVKEQGRSNWKLEWMVKYLTLSVPMSPCMIMYWITLELV